MTARVGRDDALLDGLAFERLELSRGGSPLARIAGTGEPRWVELGDGTCRELRPEQDSSLPVATRLDELRREYGAELLAWRPGRRLVLRLRRPGTPRGRAVLKAVRVGRLRATLARHVEGTRTARAAGLLAAEILAVEPPSASFVMRDLGGEPVRVTARNARHFHHLGAALAVFQQVPAGPTLQRHGAGDELDVLDRLAERVGRLTGALPAGWSPGRSGLGAALSGLGNERWVRAHRDLHDGQLLAIDRRTALVDFDLLCLADEALDPANLLAHLELRVLQGLATEEAARTCAQAFRAGFARGDDERLQRRLQVWGAAALLRLALVYSMRPPYAHLAAELVARARVRQGEGGDGSR